jgi:putative acetyltransferase
MCFLQIAEREDWPFLQKETDMEYSDVYKGRENEIVALFRDTFTASEGAEEGAVIGKLVTEFFATTREGDIWVFTAWEDGALAGAIIFSRLRYDQDDRSVFILAPVAVKTILQGRGIGQRLLTYGLNEIRKHGIDVAMTYGDPNYYTKVGFVPITEDQARAPLRLSFPHGWMAQSLTDRPLDPLKGPSHCVDALNSPDYW